MVIVTIIIIIIIIVIIIIIILKNTKMKSKVDSKETLLSVVLSLSLLLADQVVS